jgi:hypothetical protein
MQGSSAMYGPTVSNDQSGSVYLSTDERASRSADDLVSAGYG